MTNRTKYPSIAILLAATLMGCSSTDDNVYVDSNGCQFERVGIRLVLLWEQTEEGWAQKGCRTEEFADAVRVPNSRLGTISRRNPALIRAQESQSLGVVFPGSASDGS